MNKDIIYIDVEDDITAIIGKIKASNEKIIALVPPKRVGVLQSAVNLRLLQRMANNGNKKLVLITNNQALIALSAAALIPVAKNLQSKPELAQISALSIDDEEDIIDGSSLPVGELERTADIPDGSTMASASGAVDKKPLAIATLGATALSKAKRTKSGIKVPNFTTFRKRLFIGAGAGLLLIGFLVWAIWFAPAAKVIITARVTAAPINTIATLGGTAATDVKAGTIQSVVQQTKKDISVDFDATGTKNIGERASGTMTLSNVYSTEGSITVPAGSKFSNADFTFVSSETVVVPRAQFVGGLIPGKADVPVIAEESGDEYNLSPRAYTSDSVDGISAQGDQMAGGTTKIASVVTAEDVQKASEKLVELPSEDVKKQLAKLFSSDDVVIDDSFTIVRAAAVSTPAVGAEATGKVKLTSSATYALTGIAKSDIEMYLKADLDKQLSGRDDQRMYDTGADKAKLSEYTKVGEVATVQIISTGKIGPRIDEAEIKEQVKGKIYGEIQQSLESIDGISTVDVQFPYFWVRTVPNNTDKIDVEFKLENE